MKIPKRTAQFINENYPLIREWVLHNERHRRLQIEEIHAELVSKRFPDQMCSFNDFCDQSKDSQPIHSKSHS